MKINLIRIANSIDPNAPYLKDSEEFISNLNNELFDYDISLVENEPDLPFNIIFIETGGSEQKFLNIYKELSEPYILLSNSKNNSLAACYEIDTFLSAQKLTSTLLIGEEDEIAMIINNMVPLCLANKKMRNYKLGVIGEPSDWLIASKIDYKTAKEVYGCDIVDISLDEFYKEYEIEHNEIIVPKIKELEKKWPNKEILNQALRFYKTLKSIVKKHHLNAFTLRCFDLIEKYKNTACLAFSLLNEEGIVATCEGDIPSLLSMCLIKAIFDQPSFQANPSKISIKDSKIILSHCTIPLNMCAKYELMTHFESGLGIGVRGEMKKTPVTIFKLTPDLKNYLAIKGEITNNLTLSSYCRTQIEVSLQEQELMSFIGCGFGNHVVVMYGNHINEIYNSLTTFKVYPKVP